MPDGSTVGGAKRCPLQAGARWRRARRPGLNQGMRSADAGKGRPGMADRSEEGRSPPPALFTFAGLPPVMIRTDMTTTVDISLDALAAAGAAAAAEADEEARAAGIEPAGLLKRVRTKMATRKTRLIRTVMSPRKPFRLKKRFGIGTQPARRKLGG